MTPVNSNQSCFACKPTFFAQSDESDISDTIKVALHAYLQLWNLV